jgi:hypothetical protein
MKAPALRGPPARADANERRSALFREGKTSQILGDTFTRRFYESFPESPVSVEKRRAGRPSRPGT